MTKEEEKAKVHAMYAADYAANHEKYLEKSRRYYRENRDVILVKQALHRQRKRDGATFTAPTPSPSIDALEEQMPYAMKANRKGLRKEFLKIPITQRPPYDVWLKMKILEHIKTTSQ